MIINNEKEIKNFIKDVNDMNQKLKNSRNNSFYTLHNSLAYSIRPSEDYNIGISKIFINNLLGKKLTGIIDGKELYKFISTYKKSIDEIIIDEDKFTIKCNNLKTEFSSVPFDRKNKNINEYRLYYKKMDKYLEPMKKSLYDEIIISKDLKEEIKKANIPIKIASKKCHIFVCNRFLYNWVSKDDFTIKVYSTNIPNLFIGRSFDKDKKFIICNYFTFIN